MVLTIGFITPELNQVYILLFILLASPGFMAFGGFLFLGVNPEGNRKISILLAFGKASALFPAVLGALNAIGIVTFQTAPYQLSSMGLVFGIIILFDLLFLLFLVSYNRRNSPTVKDKGEQLPKLEEFEVEE